jgi:AAA domain
MPVCGFGLLSGQWGTGKTFILFDLAASLMTGQPFCGETIKRQCGVLLIAAEGAQEVRLRLGAMVREKCGNAKRMPFRWYENAPVLLQKGSAEKFIAMARQADASLQAEFGLPLGLVIIDTLGACTGFTKTGEENDSAVGQAIMDVLKAVSLALNCFALGVSHFGKDVSRGTRGNSSREDAGDVVWACLGDRTVSGSVVNTRLAVRKHKGGEQGLEFPFTLRKVVEPEPDEDGDPITTMVVDWHPAGSTGGAGGTTTRPKDDPWAEARREDQRAALLRLKRALMAILADQGVDLPIPPDGPVARMVSQELVRVEFYRHTPAEGTPEQKRKVRHMQFSRSLAYAEGRQLVGVEEIGDVTYLRLTRPDPRPDEAEFDPQGPKPDPQILEEDLE